jgi:dihydrofolate reductase
MWKWDTPSSPRRIDALVMGRKTFETVLGFGIEWPYQKPVFVLSHSLRELPAGYVDKVFLMKGALSQVLSDIHARNCHRLYIDGGVTIQNFLKEDLIDEMIITTIPIVLGGGMPLFAELAQPLRFDLVGSRVFSNALVQNHYLRKRQ